MTIILPGSQPPLRSHRSALAPSTIRLVPAHFGPLRVAVPLCPTCLAALLATVADPGTPRVLGPLVPLLSCADCGRPNLLAPAAPGWSLPIPFPWGL